VGGQDAKGLRGGTQLACLELPLTADRPDRFIPPRPQQPDLVRLVVGQAGHVAMHMQLILRLDYGAIIPWVRRTEHGIRAIAGPDALELYTDVRLRGEPFTTVADFTDSAGQRVPFVLIWHASHLPPPSPLDPEETLRQTEH
jgi:hypothetical protein